MQVEQIRALVNVRKIQWTTHVVERLQERGIHPDDVKVCLLTGEIIEDYLEDYPFPSCLVMGCTQGNIHLHVVVSIGMGMLWVITAYFPTDEKWEVDRRTRRKEEG